MLFLLLFAVALDDGLIIRGADADAADDDEVSAFSVDSGIFIKLALLVLLEQVRLHYPDCYRDFIILTLVEYY